MGRTASFLHMKYVSFEGRPKLKMHATKPKESYKLSYTQGSKRDQIK